MVGTAVVAAVVLRAYWGCLEGASACLGGSCSSLWLDPAEGHTSLRWGGAVSVPLRWLDLGWLVHRECAVAYVSERCWTLPGECAGCTERAGRAVRLLGDPERLGSA